MSRAFNLTAQINLQAPANLKTVVAQIRREIGTVSANVNVTINPQSARSIDNVRTRLTAMNNVLIQSRQNAESLNQTFRSLSSALGSIQSASGRTISSINSTNTSVANTAKSIKVATSEMEEFGKQSALAIRRFAAFSVVTSGIFALINAVNSGVKAFIDFDKEMTKLQQVTGKGVIGLKGLEKEITSLSVSLGVSSKSLVDVASTLAQAGLSAEETRQALSALAKTELAPSFDNLTDTTEGAIAAMRQFGIQAKDLEKALGSINAVSAAFAVESKDIIAAIQRTGGVFAASSKGVSQGTDALNEFIAVFTSVRATTRESAETIATGLRTIFTRIQRAKTIDALKEFGVTLTDLEGKFVGPYEAVKRLSGALNQLDPRDLRFSQIVEELGGFRQIGKVIPLIQQFATAQDALKVAQKGQGSLAKDQAIAQKSLANQLAKVREQFLALVRDVGKSQSFQGLFKIVIGLSSGLIRLASAFKPIIPILAIFGAVKGLKASTQFASGFANAIRKGGGATSIGNRVGQGLTGTNNRDREQATQRASQAITTNTTALTTLTAAINHVSNVIVNSTNALGNIMNNRGNPPGNTLNSGGVVRRFARGGLVPGSGNTDSVPAMLMPGEFVIRKNAVNTLGANNLHKINKYASGGPILGADKVGAAVLQGKETKHEEITTEDILKATKNEQNKKYIASQLKKNKNYNFIKEPLSEETYKIFDQGIEHGLVSGLNSASASISKRLKIPNPAVPEDKVKNFIAGLNDASKGNLFEQIISSMINKGNWEDKPDPQKPFDFIGGLGAASELFPALSGIYYADGKASMDAASKTNMANKIGNQIMEESGQRTGRQYKEESKPIDLVEAIKAKFGGNNKSNIEKVSDQTVQRAINQALTEGTIIKKFGITSKLKETLAGFASGGLVPKFAAGGLAQAKDSLEKYFTDSAPINLGLSNTKSLNKKERKSLASDVRNLRQLRTAAPEELYSSLSRNAFDKFASDTGLNKNPNIPEGTKLNQTVAYYAQEVAKIVGKTFKLPGFVSTSKDYTVAKSFLDNAPRAKDKWAAMLTIKTKKNAQGIDVPEQLNDRKIDVAKQDINPRTGKMDTFFMKQPHEENEVVLSPRSRFRVNTAKYVNLFGRNNLWADVQQFAMGGRAKGIQGAPLVDDILQASGSILPKPSSAIQALIKAGGGAVDVDRTLKRTIGDKAYAKAPTAGAKEASLETYFRNDLNRLRDLKDAPLTQFGKELQAAVKSGQIDPRKVSIISKSKRVKGAAEYLMSQFGIPVQNMVFTQGASKQPAIDAIRNKGSRVDRVARFATGGGVGTDTVPALLTPGEFVINKKAASRIGSAKLNQLNKADKIQKYNKGGFVQHFSGGGAANSTGTTTPWPADLMKFTSVVKQAAEEQRKVNDELEYFVHRAKDGGHTLEEFRKVLATKIITQSNKIKSDLPEQKQNLRMTMVANANQLRGTTNTDLINTALAQFADRLREIDPSASADAIQRASADIVNGLIDGTRSIGSLIKSSTALSTIFNKTYSDTEAIAEGFRRVADEAGLTADELRKIADPANIKRQQFIQSSQGQKFGRLSEIAPDLIEKFSNSKTGSILSKASDINTNGFQTALSLFGKKMGTIGDFLDKKFQMVGGSLVGFGAGLSLLGDKIPDIVDSFGAGSNSTAAGVAGGVTGAGQGLASGAVLGGQVAGPVGALIGGVTGALITGINGALNGFNNKKLENSLKGLDQASTDLEIAFKKLDENMSNANLGEAEAKFKTSLDAVAKVSGQANLTAGGTARGITEVLRSIDPTGLVKSTTGAPQEAEARQATLSGLTKAVSDAEKLGVASLSKVSTKSISDFMDSVSQIKNPADKQMAMARGNQSYQALKKNGLNEEGIFISKYIANQKQQGRGDDDIQKDLVDPKKRAAAIQTGKELMATEGEIALKQAILTRTSKELAVATENIIDVYRRAQSGLEKYGQNLERFEADALARAGRATGGAKITNVDRSSEQALGNISAYSIDEVKRIANQTSAIAGGGESGDKLKNGIITAKILQDELPKALKGASDNNIDDVIDKLEEGFKNAGVKMSDQVKLQLKENLQNKTAGRQGVGLSDLADDTSLLDNAMKAAEEALKLGQQIQQKYNDTLQASINLIEKQGEYLEEAAELQRKAADIRLNAELDLAKALGKTPTLDQLNKPFETEIKSQTSGLIPGGSSDPKAIAGAINRGGNNAAALQQRINTNKGLIGTPGADNTALNEAIKKDTMALNKQNRALNNGTKALEKLANNSEAASNALNAIQDRQQLAQNANNAIEKILTADGFELAEMTRQLGAYTKVIGGKASKQELGDLNFRKDSFAGLRSLQGLMPESMFKQMQAKASLEMIKANPKSKEILGGTIGIDSQGNQMTIEDALKMQAEGKDPVQQQYIDAYKAATERQATAADKLADNALKAAESLNMDITELFNGIENKLATILSDAQKNTETPKPVVEAPPEPKDTLSTAAAGPATVDIPGITTLTKSTDDLTIAIKALTTAIGVVGGGAAAVKLGSKLLPEGAMGGIKQLLSGGGSSGSSAVGSTIPTNAGGGMLTKARGLLRNLASPGSLKVAGKGVAGLSTAISAATEGASFVSDPSQYVSNKQKLVDSGLARAQQRTNTGQFIGDSAVGAVGGALNPVGKIVEGGFTGAGLIGDISNWWTSSARTKRAEERLRQSRALEAANSSIPQRGILNSGPIPTPLSTQEVTQTTSEPTMQNKVAGGTAYTINLDESSRKFLETFNTTINSFGSYVDKLAAIHIPEKIEMTGTHVVDVRISGAAAFDGLKKDFNNMIQVEIGKQMEKIWTQSGGKLGEPANKPSNNTNGSATGKK